MVYDRVSDCYHRRNSCGGESLCDRGLRFRYDERNHGEEIDNRDHLQNFVDAPASEKVFEESGYYDGENYDDRLCRLEANYDAGTGC
jgi:hypothetical protein